MRLVFFGDSLTWGGYGGNYVKEIRQQVGGQHEIINAGVGGNTILNLARRYDRDVCKHNPDAVFIMVGGNDAVSYSQPDTRPYYRKSQQIPEGVVSPDTFRTTYRDLLLSLQANYISVFVGLPPAEANPTVAAAMRQYNDIAHDVAASLNIPTLDLFAQFVPATIPERRNLNIRMIQQIADRQASGWSDWYSAQTEGGYSYTFDGLHFTPKAAKQVANAIIKFIEL